MRIHVPQTGGDEVLIATPPVTSQDVKQLVARLIVFVIAAFYAYGALVHVLNMLSLTGFDWGEAPAKWQALDVMYLILEVAVVIGLLLRSQIGICAFYVAALSHIALYTALRDWVLDVPDAFHRSTDEIAYLDHLVIFHLVTCVAMSAAIWLIRPKGGRA
ncbi:MAG: hypothetical protein AAFN59_00350 [Pseudomonadota bacterium]